MTIEQIKNLSGTELNEMLVRLTKKLIEEYPGAWERYATLKSPDDIHRREFVYRCLMMPIIINAENEGCFGSSLNYIFCVDESLWEAVDLAYEREEAERLIAARTREQESVKSLLVNHWLDEIDELGALDEN